MNKKLIALAVAAVVAAPAAMADVTVYGKVHMDIRSTDTDNTVDNWSVNSNASRLGFKGSEDLGNGLKAIFKYEMTYSGVDSGTAIGGARNSYLGLSGDFGTFIVGRHDTPAKSAYYASGADFLGDTIIDLNRAGFTEVRATNSIAYMSPSMSGFKIAAAIVPGEDDSYANTGSTTLEDDNNGIADSYSLGLTYKGHGLKVGAGYENLGDTGDTTASPQDNDSTMWRIGASYTFNNVSLGAQYQDLDDATVTVNNNLVSTGSVTKGANRESNTWAVSAKVKFGNNAVIANYGQLENDHNGVEVNDRDVFGIGFQHTMSKRTSVYVAYDNEEDDATNTDTNRFAVGMVHSF